MREQIDRVKNWKQFLNENNNYEDTSWTMEIDGEEKTITIHEIQVFLKKTPIIDIKVDDIKSKCIHLNKTDKETLLRSQKSDLNYPIIICKGLDGKLGMILDGHHRLKKAIDNDINMIKAKVLDLKIHHLYIKKMFG